MPLTWDEGGGGARWTPDANLSVKPGFLTDPHQARKALAQSLFEAAQGAPHSEDVSTHPQFNTLSPEMQKQILAIQQQAFSTRNDNGWGAFFGGLGVAAAPFAIGALTGALAGEAAGAGAAGGTAAELASGAGLGAGDVAATIDFGPSFTAAGAETGIAPSVTYAGAAGAGAGSSLYDRAGYGYGMNPEGATIDPLTGAMLPQAVGAGVAAPTSFLSQISSGLGLDKIGLGGALSIGSGIYGLMQSEQLKKLAEQAARQQDPFAPYRSQYARQLQELMANPSSVTSIPGYEAGMQAVERSMAAQGYLGSGNMMDAMAKYGGGFYQQQLDNLMRLSGANFSPTGGNALISGYGNAVNLASASLGSIGYGATMPQLQALLARYGSGG